MSATYSKTQKRKKVKVRIQNIKKTYVSNSVKHRNKHTISLNDKFGGNNSIIKLVKEIVTFVF